MYKKKLKKTCRNDTEPVNPPRFTVMPVVLRNPSVPSPIVHRLFTGCSPILIAKQPVNNRYTDGGMTVRSGRG